MKDCYETQVLKQGININTKCPNHILKVCVASLYRRVVNLANVVVCIFSNFKYLICLPQNKNHTLKVLPYQNNEWC